MKEILKKIVYKILEISLTLATREQGLSSLKRKLSYVIPDLSDQYTSFKIDSNYLVNKVRSLHSFQISLAQNAIDMLKYSAPTN